MADDLEVGKTQTEVAEPTLSGEASPTELGLDPTVNITTTKEFREARDRAVGKSTASLQAQVTVAKMDIKAKQAEIDAVMAAKAKSDEDLSFMETKLNQLATEKFGDDDETLTGYKNKLSLELEKRKLDAQAKHQQLIATEQDGFRLAYQLGESSIALKKKYHVPDGVLETCSTVEQMETIAKAFPSIEDVKQENKEQPKFDSLAGDGGGGSAEKLTAEDKVILGLHREKKQGG